MAFKGTIQDFYNPLTAPQTVSSMHTQAASAQSCANHVQHIKHFTCNMLQLTDHDDSNRKQDCDDDNDINTNDDDGSNDDGEDDNDIDNK